MAGERGSEVTRLGALFGVAAGAIAAKVAADYFPGPETWVMVAIGGGVTIILYIAGRVAVDAASNPAQSPVGDLARYALVGLGAGANAIAIVFVYKGLLGEPAAWILAGGSALILLLSVFEPISQSDVYQAFVGWLTWFLPLAWPIVALGAGFFAVGLLGALFLGLPGVDFFKIAGFDVDWKTGTIFLKGTFIGNLNPEDTAFNMGNFAFVDNLSSEWHMDHEAGHTLNLATFGFLFHVVGALDEMVLGGREKAFSERLAESNVPGSTRASLSIPMWG